MTTLIRYNQHDLLNIFPASDLDDPNTLGAIPLTGLTTTAVVADTVLDGKSSHLELSGIFDVAASGGTYAELKGIVLSTTTFQDGILKEFEAVTGGRINGARDTTVSEYLNRFTSDDVFIGSATHALDDAVQGLAGNDVFTGNGSGAFADRFFGGAGEDTAVFRGNFDQYQITQTIVFDNSVNANATGVSINDTVLNRDGLDLLTGVEIARFADAKVALNFDSSNSLSTTILGRDLTGSIGNDTINGIIGDDTLSGSHGDDVINGLGGVDIIYGNQGLDQLSGGDGNDIIFGGQNSGLPRLADDGSLKQIEGVETLFGGIGDDVIYGNFGSDIMLGDDGADSLFGGQGDDTLSGGGGDDFINGNRGNDVWSGGAGADNFHFGPGNNQITDFSFNEGDRISGTSISQVSITDGVSGAIISNGVDTLSLTGVSASSVSDDYFI